MLLVCKCARTKLPTYTSEQAPIQCVSYKWIIIKRNGSLCVSYKDKITLWKPLNYVLNALQNIKLTEIRLFVQYTVRFMFSQQNHNGFYILLKPISCLSSTRRKLAIIEKSLICRSFRLRIETAKELVSCSASKTVPRSKFSSKSKKNVQYTNLYRNFLYAPSVSWVIHCQGWGSTWKNRFDAHSSQ